MAQQMSREEYIATREKSAVEKIIAASAGGSGGMYEWNSGKYVKFPIPPETGNLIELPVLFRFASPNGYSPWIHFFTDSEGGTKVTRCSQDKGLPRESRGRCYLCIRAKKMKAKNPDSRAARMAAATCVNMFNIIPLSEGQDRYCEDEEGQKYTRILQMKWSAFQMLGTILRANPNAMSRTDLGVLFKISKVIERKRDASGKLSEAVKKYTLQAGSKPRPLTADERALKLWPLVDEYPLMSDEDLSEALGIDVTKAIQAMPEEGNETATGVKEEF
jgi:hypothetical protein